MVKARVLDRYFRTEMTRDVDAILGLFTPEAVFQTPDRPAGTRGDTSLLRGCGGALPWPQGVDYPGIQ